MMKTILILAFVLFASQLCLLGASKDAEKQFLDIVRSAVDNPSSAEGIKTLESVTCLEGIPEMAKAMFAVSLLKEIQARSNRIYSFHNLDFGVTDFQKELQSRNMTCTITPTCSLWVQDASTSNTPYKVSLGEIDGKLKIMGLKPNTAQQGAAATP